jgi:hypothetical protein
MENTYKQRRYVNLITLLFERGLLGYSSVCHVDDHQHFEGTRSPHLAKTHLLYKTTATFYSVSQMASISSRTV